jgi:tetratricopeptide (TPR) repeat protein
VLVAESASNSESMIEPAAGGGAGRTLKDTLRQHWQAPALGAAMLLLVAGAVTAFKTAPKPEYGGELEAAKAMLDRREFAKTLDELNTKVLPNIEKGRLTAGQRREFHLMRARALYLGQKEANIDRAENNEHIVREYESAEELHAELTPKDVFFVAQSQISLGKIEEAIHRAESIEKPDSQLRIDLYKRIIELSMESGDTKNSSRALDLLSRLTSDTELANEERVWALGRQARLLVEQGYAEDAVVKVLRSLPRLEQSKSEAMAETLIALAYGYMATGSPADAASQLERASTMLGPDHPLMSEVTLLRAELDHERGDAAAARERYLDIVDRFGHTPQVIPALLGLGETESQLANQGAEAAGVSANPDELRESSLERYTELVSRIKKGERQRDVSPSRVGQSLIGRCREQIDRKDDRMALRFGELAEDLYTRQNSPPALLKLLAFAHRRVANDALAEAGKGGVLSLAQADPATRREAREHLLKSGDYSREHAARSVLANNGEDRDSLWDAADAFDRAGDLESSLAAFKQFAETFASDLRVPEAKYRLARTHQARGDFDMAASMFRQLSEDPKAGPYADQARVPMAQTLLSDTDAANDVEGERVLGTVVSGAYGGPETEIYRSALLVLGRRYYDTNRFALAIQSLDEYLSRVEEPAPVASKGAAHADAAHAASPSTDDGHGGASADADHGRKDQGSDGHGESHAQASDNSDADVHADPHGMASADGDHGSASGGSHGEAPAPAQMDDVHSVRFVLAEAHRKLAAEMTKALENTMPEGERRDTLVARDGHLRAAVATYDLVRKALEAEHHRTALRDLQLRNAYLYQGDCVFELGDYSAAIKRYDAAKERYSRDPASLVAMTQIVTSLLKLGKPAEAEVANTRAKRFYESLPESVWDDPSLPMSRQAWQRWLDAQAALAAGGELPVGKGRGVATGAENEGAKE